MEKYQMILLIKFFTYPAIVCFHKSGLFEGDMHFLFQCYKDFMQQIQVIGHFVWHP